MHVRSISTDHWTGVLNRETEFASPTWSIVETAIRNLDGKARTMVTLLCDDEAHLTVGGGRNGQYVVYATRDNLNFFSLNGHDNASEKVLLFVGGQEGDYPRYSIVDVALALRAARTFFETGTLDTGLKWT